MQTPERPTHIRIIDPDGGDIVIPIPPLPPDAEPCAPAPGWPAELDAELAEYRERHNISFGDVLAPRPDDEITPSAAQAPRSDAGEPSDESRPVDTPESAAGANPCVTRCQSCGCELDRPHWRQRYCSGRCRVRAHRGTPVLHPREGGRR